MPYIDVKLTRKISDSEKEQLKDKLGEAISLLHKTESYLMFGVCDAYDLYFAGKKLENGAFVSISVFGKVSSTDAENMTAKVCEIFKKQFDVSGKDIYITYAGFSDWGWNGGNF